MPVWVIVTLLQCGWRLSSFMANPGEEWQVSDAITTELPGTRLIFVAVSGDDCLLAYERGGQGHLYSAIFFKKDAGTYAATIEGSAELEVSYSKPVLPDLAAVRAQERRVHSFSVRVFLP